MKHKVLVLIRRLGRQENREGSAIAAIQGLEHPFRPGPVRSQPEGRDSAGTLGHIFSVDLEWAAIA